MNRQEKKTVVDTIKKDFEQCQASFIITMKGMTVASVQRLRRDIYAKRGKIKVAKNTLLKKATSDLAGVNELAPYFKDQIAIVFADEEVPAIAKILHLAAKENEQLKYTVGTFDARLMTAEEIELLATLPPREVLLAKLAGLLKMHMVRFLLVLKEFEKKKQV